MGCQVRLYRVSESITEGTEMFTGVPKQNSTRSLRDVKEILGVFINTNARWTPVISAPDLYIQTGQGRWPTWLAATSTRPYPTSETWPRTPSSQQRLSTLRYSEAHIWSKVGSSVTTLILSEREGISIFFYPHYNKILSMLLWNSNKCQL